MTEVTIREAELGDASAIAAIQVNASLVAYKDIFSSPSAMLTVERRTPVWRQIITCARGQRRVLVAEDSMEICGYADFGPSRDRDQNVVTMGELYSIYVRPERWKQGIGGKLLLESMYMLAHVGFSACTLWVLADNSPARRFYERYGWRPDGVEKPVDAQVMEVRYRTDELAARGWL